MSSVVLDGGVGQSPRAAEADRLAEFRADLYGCLTRRPDELFELTDALLCIEGPVRSLVGLCLAPEHRRGHGALYDAVCTVTLAPPAVAGTPGASSAVRRPLPRSASPAKLTVMEQTVEE